MLRKNCLLWCLLIKKTFASNNSSRDQFSKLTSMSNQAEVSSSISHITSAGEVGSGGRANSSSLTTPYQIWTLESLASLSLPPDCVTALTCGVACDKGTQEFKERRYFGSLDSPQNISNLDTMCDPKCDASLKDWHTAVKKSCEDFDVLGRPATELGGNIWSGWNQTCLRDIATGEYCNSVIDQMPMLESIQQISKSDACSFCYIQRLKIMQESPYSPYDAFYKTELEIIQTKCGLREPTDIAPAILSGRPETKPLDFCSATKWYTTKPGDSCDSVALAARISSMELFEAHKTSIQNCSQLEPGLKLCLPHSCANVYAIKGQDTCHDIEERFNLVTDSLSKYNPWLFEDCSNLQTVGKTVGHVICLEAQGGIFNSSAPIIGDSNRAGGRGS